MAFLSICIEIFVEFNNLLLLLVQIGIAKDRE